MRLILRVQQYVRENARPLSHPAGAADIQAAKDFIKYFSAPQSRNEDRGDPDTEADDVQWQQWEYFIGVFNGGLTSWFSSGYLLHHCAGPSCCKGGWDETVWKMTQAIIRTIFRHRPPVPVLARWTKTRPAAHFHLIGASAHSILPGLMVKAFEALRAELDQAAADASRHSKAKMDDELVREFSWNAASGKRVTAIREWWADPHSRLNLLLYAVVLEP
eukprot:5162333-Pyramimonas_sp.AAC.1